MNTYKLQLLLGPLAGVKLRGGDRQGNKGGLEMKARSEGRGKEREDLGGNGKVVPYTFNA